MVVNEGSADCRDRGLRVVSSSPTSGLEVGVAARDGQVSRSGLTEIDPRGPSLPGVFVCACVCLWARLQVELFKCLVHTCISFSQFNSAPCVFPFPPLQINPLLNVSARFCVFFIGLARCMLGNLEAANCAFGPTDLGNHPLGLCTVRAR